MAALDFDAIVNSSLAEDPAFGNSAIPAGDIEAADQGDWRDVTLGIDDLLGGKPAAPVEAPAEAPVSQPVAEAKPDLPPEPEYNPRPSSALPEGKVTPLLDGVTDGMDYPAPRPVGSSTQEQPTEKPMPQMSPSPEDPWYKKAFNYLFDDPEMNRAAAMNEYAARKIADEEGVSVESVYRDVGGARPMINPEGRQASQAFTETADVLWEEVKRTPEGAANAFLRTIRGGDIPLQDQSWLDEAITATKDDRNPADFDPNYKSFNNLGASLGYSLTTLVSSIVASSATTAATGGNVPAGVTAGMAASGAVAYRGSKDQFLTNVKDKLNQTLSMTENRTLTEEEWEAAKEQYDAAATKYGAWEAIPEAVSNAIFLKAFVKPLGAVDDVAKLQRINQKAAALAAEQATETATGVGQNRAEVEAGLTAEEIDVVDAFRNQFIQTLIVSGGMMSATATSNAAKDFYVKNVEPKIDPKSALGRAILQELESVGSNPTAIDQFSRDSLNPNSSVVDPSIVDPGQTVPEEQLGEQVVEPDQAEQTAPTEQTTEYNQQDDAAAIADMEAAAAPAAAADPIQEIVDQDTQQETTPVEPQEDPVVEQTAIEDMVDEALTATEAAIDTLEDGPIVSTPAQEEIKAPDYKEIIPAVSQMVKMKVAEVQAIAEEVGLNPQNTKGALIDQLADLRGGNAQPQINYADPRLAYKEYRDGLVEFLEREWVPNGGISIVPKPGAKPTSNTGDIIYDYGADNVIRTQSVNAKWVQGLIQQGVTKQGAVNALQKAIDGKPLTQKQTDVVKTVLDESEGGNYGVFIPQSPATQQDMEAATQGIPLPTETEFGDYNTFDYVDDVSLAEAKNLVELHDKAARLGKAEEAMQIMEQQIPDAQIAQQLYKLIEDTKNGRSSETGTTGNQEGQANAQAQETTEQPAAAQDPGPTQEVTPTERPTSDDLNLEAGAFNPPALPTLVNRRDQGDPKNQKAKGMEDVGISGGEKEGDITSRSMVDVKLAKVGFDGAKRQSIPENFEERVYNEYPEATLNKIQIVDRNETLRYQAAHYNGGIVVVHTNFSWINWNTMGHLLAHELGHASHSLLGDTLNNDPRVIEELGAIEQLLYPNLRADIERTMQDPEKAKLVDVQFLNYLLSAEELIAEFNVSRLIDPARAKAIAPVTTGLLESVAKDPNLVIERKVFPSGYKILKDTVVKSIDTFKKEYKPEKYESYDVVKGAKYNPARDVKDAANEDLNQPGLKLTKATERYAASSLNAIKQEMENLGLIPRQAESRVDMLNRMGRVIDGISKLRKMTLEEAKQAVADKKLSAQEITDLYQDIKDLTSGRGQNRMMYKRQLDEIYAYMAREGIIEPERTAEEQADFELTQQTQADIIAQEEAAAAAKRAEEEAKKKAQADAEVDNFQLTGSDLAADQNPNQTDIMDVTEQKPAQVEVNTDSDVVQPKNDFETYREWSAERRARIAELRKKYPEADAKLKELEETVGVKIQDYREGEPITQEQKMQWSSLVTKEQDKYSKTKNSEKEINELFDIAGTEIWQNSAYQEFAVENETRNREVPNIVDGFIQADPVTVADIKEITEGAERKNIMIADIVYSMQPGETYTLKEIKALDLPAHKYAQKISKKKFQFGSEVKFDLESAVYYGFVEQLRTSPVTYRLPSTTNDVQFQREDPAYRMADTAYNRAANEFLSVVPEDALADEVMGAVDEGLFTPEMSRLLRAFERVDFLGFEYPSQALDQAFSGPEGLDGYEVPTALKSAIGRFTNDTFGQNAAQFSTQEGIRARIATSGGAVSGETITRLFNNLNTNATLEIVQTESQLPQHVLDALERQGGKDAKVLGVHSRGVVYIVSSNAKSRAEVEESLLHEVSHYGAHRIVGGDAIYRQYADVYEMMGGHNGIMKTARRMGFGKELLPYINEAASDIALGDWMAKAHIVDEFVAHANGKNAYNKLPQKIKKAVNELVGYIRNKLRGLGFVELSKFNDADLAFMIRNIMRNARVQNARMAGAADVQFNIEVGKTAIQKMKNMLKVKYTSPRIDKIYKWYEHPNGRESKAYIVRVNPREFIDATTPSYEIDEIYEDPRELEITQDINLMTLTLDIGEMHQGTKGMVARITGHEGRHRMAWFAKNGMTDIPVVIAMKDYADQEKIEQLTLLPQQYGPEQGVKGMRVENLQLASWDNKKNIDDEFVALPGEENAAQFALRPRRNNPQQQIPILGQWTLGDSGKIENFQYEIQDKFVDLKAVLNAIEAAGGNVTDQWNPYLREELSHGRSAKLNKDFIQRELNPLLKEMSDAGITIQQLDEFLHARHAKEANAQIATINPSMPDGGSGLLNAEADAYMNSLSQPERAKLTQIANKVEGIIRETQRMMVNYGLESQATIDQWNTTYKHYVPLQREGVIEGALGMAQGISVRGSSTKRRMGSDKGVIDIFANIAMQRERVISRGEKNRTATALFGLVLQNPNEKFWLAINPDTINTTNAQAGMVPQLVNMGIDPADAANIAAAPMERVIDSSGMVTLRMSTRFKEMPNIITLRINGKDRAILFNQADERAFRLAQSLKNIDAEMAGKFVQSVGNFTRYIAAVNTQYNPVFGLKNYARDVMTGGINLSNTPQASWWNSAKVTANSIPAVMGIWKDLRAERKGQQPSTAWGRLFEEFEAEGGKTGYRDLYARSDERARELQKVLNGYDPNMGPKKFMGLVGRGTLNWLSDFNEAIENGVRLAAYKLGIDNGMSKQQAASMAKNLTVNFNRKGRKTGTIAPWYAFFNAAVQGTARIGQAAFNKKTGAALVGGLMGFGVLQALLMQLAGFEDDEIPEFVKDKNIIIPTGWLTGEEKTYVNYPMALGWNAVIGLGRRITEAAFKEDVNIAEEVIGMGGMVLDAFNPVGAGTPAQMISPTILDPIVALSENKDGLGRPIAREDFSSLDQTPGYLRARENASIISTYISEGLNYLTGGTEFTKGKLSPTPDQIDYLFGVATGGPGRELLKIEKSLNAYVDEDELATYNIPIVGSFIGNAAQSAAVRSRFYDHVKKMNDHQREIEGRAKREEDYDDYLKKYPEAELYKASDRIYRKISDLKSKQRTIRDTDGDKDEIKLIDEAILDLMYNFNEAVKDYKRN